MGNSTSGNTYSDIALGITVVAFLVHGPEFLFPMMARHVANVIMGLLNWKKPSTDEFLSLDDCETMLKSAITAAPPEKATSAKDYIFIMTFEQRQGSVGHVASFLAAMYAMSLPLAERHPIHVFGIAVGVGMIIGNSNHALGWSTLGYNPMVTYSGFWLGVCFTPFWIVFTLCQFMAYKASKNE